MSIDSLSDAKWLAILIIPAFALVLVLAWMLLASRGGRPVHLKLSGFGVNLDLASGDADQRAALSSVAADKTTQKE